MDINNEDEIRQLAIELHKRMATNGDIFFFPTGCVFLTMDREEIRNIMSQKSTVTDKSAWTVYAQWHETVHMLQLATSPFLFMNALGIAHLARKASVGKCSEEDLIEMSNIFQKCMSRLSLSKKDLSSWHVIEGHAVAQALLWLCPRNNQCDLWALAESFYDKNDDSRQYLILLELCVQKFSDQYALRLCTRFCFVSLQSADPIQYFLAMYGQVNSLELAKQLNDCTPNEFLKYFNIDVSLVITPLQNRESVFSKHPYMELFRVYFEDFKLLSIEDRLNLMMCTDASSASFFKPMCTVYPDGSVTSNRNWPKPFDSKIVRQNLSMTLELVRGIEVLQSQITE